MQLGTITLEAWFFIANSLLLVLNYIIRYFHPEEWEKDTREAPIIKFMFLAGGLPILAMALSVWNFSFCFPALVILCTVYILVYKRPQLMQKIKEWMNLSNLISLLLWSSLIAQDYYFFLGTTPKTNMFDIGYTIAITYFILAGVTILVGGYFGAVLDILFPAIAKQRLGLQRIAAAWPATPEEMEFERSRYGRKAVRLKYKLDLIVGGAYTGQLICLTLLLLIKFLIQAGAIIL